MVDAESTPLGETGQRIDSILKEEDSYTGNAFTGAVLVAKDGEILLSRGYGLANEESNLPNSPDTRFHIASLTKQFTAMAILILQTDGRLDVQDLICAYLEKCPEAWQPITIHHLLTHSSGIPDYVGLLLATEERGEPSFPTQLIARFDDKPLRFQPGERFEYSNSGYVVLGYIIEKASGDSYGAFLEENIFEPLEMHNTGYDPNDDTVAIGYSGADAYDVDFVDMSNAFSAGGLYSTVVDLYRWDRALYTEQLVPYDLLQLMFTPHVPPPGFMPNEEVTNLGYGYGWFVGFRNETPTEFHNHGGFVNGYVSFLERYPSDDGTLIVLSNFQNTRIEHYAGPIFKLMFDK